MTPLRFLATFLHNQLLLYMVLFFMLCCISSTLSAQTTSLNVKYICSEITAGYDYEFKIKLFVDGSYIGESSPVLSSIANQTTFTVPSGQRSVKIIGCKKYQGNWEESLKSNNYTVDSKFEDSMTLNQPACIDLIFRLSTGTEIKSITYGSATSIDDPPGIPLTPR